MGVMSEGWGQLMVPLVLLRRLKVFDAFALLYGICYLPSCAFANVSADVDDEDTVCHVYLVQVHVVEHGFGAFSPHLVVARMTEQSHADDDVAFEREAFLCGKKGIFETCAAAEGDDGVAALHGRLCVG